MLNRKWLLPIADAAEQRRQVSELFSIHMDDTTFALHARGIPACWPKGRCAAAGRTGLTRGEIRDALADIVERLDLPLLPAPNVEPTIRLTVDVPESLHARIKIACARNESKMNTLILEGGIARSNTTSGR